MGIYNCARIYRSPHLVRCRSQIQFDQPIKQESFQVFQIIGQNPVTIIRHTYRRRGVNYVSFDPYADNQFLTILPGDRVAVFYPHEFSDLTIHQLPDIRKLTLPLSIHPVVSSKKELDNVLLAL
ncbi:MAG: hypothetical protein HC880_01635 [Bacteroidia bacterium]|nr:hypothetical protein [Bacteroidia bacterium]